MSGPRHRWQADAGRYSQECLRCGCRRRKVPDDQYRGALQYLAPGDPDWRTTRPPCRGPDRSQRGQLAGDVGTAREGSK